MDIVMDINFYRNKKVFITGHTGFKGSWLSQILVMFGAEVSGYSLAPIAPANLFELCNISQNVKSYFGDIRDFDNLIKVFQKIKPDIVIHLAAQPIVRDSFKFPRNTYEINVMGTVNILECIRQSTCVKSFLNVTTDKVYENKEWMWGYRENETLNGFDPYSNSKSCSDLATSCFRSCFFDDLNIAISTARAGNVIGGGDFTSDRIIPDCVRAAHNKESIIVRNPNSVRPYQNVLDCLSGYLTLVQKQYENKKFSGCYNFGPYSEDCVTNEFLVGNFCKIWGDGLNWYIKSDNGPHEATYLKLDSTKAKSTLGWCPKWDINMALKKTVEWYKAWVTGENAENITKIQIRDYFDI